MGALPLLATALLLLSLPVAAHGQVISGASVNGATLAGALVGGFAWPDADNTGLYLANRSTLRGDCVSLCSGGVDTVGSISSSSNGETIDCEKTTGGAEITHDNVTLKCAEVSDTGFYVVNLTNAAVDNLTIEDVRIECTEGGNQYKGLGAEGGGTGATFNRLEILNCENAGNIGMDNWTFTNSYLHEPDGAGGEPHYDGLEIGNSNGGLIQGNRILLDGVNDTGTVNITTYEGSNDDIVVDANLLRWGSDTVLCDDTWAGSSTNISFTDNEMTSGVNGYSNFKAGCTPATCGNIDYVTRAYILGDSACP